MSVYNHIAESNPNQAADFCLNNGYQPTDIESIAIYMETIVAQKGESAFKNVMELHPEKEVILELFQQKENNTNRNIDNIVEIKPPVMLSTSTSNMMNATGTAGTSQQTNTYILVAALIVSIAIISIKK
jgi:hypothetical protein